jgi:glycosyltransferase involved in cell wall biosynthesis
LKLLFVTDPLVTTAGAVRPALLLAERLHLLGHEVEVTSTQIAREIAKTLEYKGICHSVIRNRFSLNRSFPTFDAWAKSLLKPAKIALADENRMVINTSSCILTDSAVYYAQGTMTKTLDAISTNFSPVQKCAYDCLSPLLRLLELSLVQKLRNSAEWFVANSAFCSSLYTEWGIRVDQVIYPPLDTALFKASTSAPSEDYVLTYFGNFEKEGKFSLIKIIADSGVKVKVFGTIPDRINRTASKNIIFLGKVSSKKLVDLYSNAVFTLFAFNHEPFGYIPIESMACGTPVLTFNRQGPGETITDSQTGWLVETDEELVEMAKNIWKEGVGKSTRIACRKNALAFDVKTICKEWIDLLKKQNDKLAGT